MNTPHPADIGYLGIQDIDDFVECFPPDYGDAGPIKDISHEQQTTAEIRPAVGAAHESEDRQHGDLELTL